MPPSAPAYDPYAPAASGRPGSLPEPLPDNPQAAYPPAAMSARSPYAAAGGQVIGEAREFRESHSMEQNVQWTIWNFRVERYDASGNRLTPVPVEMRAENFYNSISEGDWVEIPGFWREGMLMRPSLVHNLTTRANVTAKTSSLTAVSLGVGKFFTWLVTLFFIGLGLVIVYAILSALSR